MPRPLRHVRLRGTHIHGTVQERFTEQGEILYRVWWWESFSIDTRLYRADELESAEAYEKGDAIEWRSIGDRRAMGNSPHEPKRQVGHKRV